MRKENLNFQGSKKGGITLLETAEELKSSFETSSLFSYLGFEIVRCEEEEIILKLPITENIKNTNQTVHGGVYVYGKFYQFKKGE